MKAPTQVTEPRERVSVYTSTLVHEKTGHVYTHLHGEEEECVFSELVEYQLLTTLDWEVLKVARFCSDTMFLPSTPAQAKALPLLPRTRVMVITVS